MSQNDMEKYSSYEDKEDKMDLGELFLYLFEKLPVILIAALICGLLTAVYALAFYQPKYETIAKIYLVDTDKSKVVSDADLKLGNSLAKDYLQIFEMVPLEEMVKEHLGKDGEYLLEKTKLTPSNPANTHMIYIAVSSTVPEYAQLVANAYAEAACDFMEMRMSVPRPTILEEASLENKPSSISRPLLIVMGILIGVFTSIVILSVMFLFDDRIKLSDDFDKYFDIPCIGILTKFDSYEAKHRENHLDKQKRIKDMR